SAPNARATITSASTGESRNLLQVIVDLLMAALLSPPLYRAVAAVASVLGGRSLLEGSSPIFSHAFGCGLREAGIFSSCTQQSAPRRQFSA
ncbi:MAG: hypothetical protein ABSD27_14060, partial [Bryobacteraceae bacterium]